MDVRSGVEGWSRGLEVKVEVRREVRSEVRNTAVETRRIGE